METVYIPPSANYRKQVAKAVLSIIFFILCYGLLLLISAALAIGCAYAGVMLALDFDNFSILKIFIGLAIVLIGFSLLYFMIRFLFKVDKVNTSMYIEVTKEDQPRLFNLLEEIVEKVGTQFPRSVYLSHEVNASVFSTVNFWSLFFPSKKNLIIGMGLINTTNYSELKAVLAHEFGHFSQKSMKIGGFVNRMNTVVGKMLSEESYKLDGYEDLEENSIIAQLARWTAESMIETIRAQLRLLYSMVNKSHFALAREMEFHADAVSVAVCGKEPLRESLLRFGLTTTSLDHVIQFYTQKINESIVSSNIYPLQRFVLTTMAEKSGLEFKNGLPQVGIHDVMKFNKSKLEIDNKWASHPKLEDRIANIESQQAGTPSLSSMMAMEILRGAESLQVALTEKLFAQINYDSATVVQSAEDFEADYAKLAEKYTLPPVFNSYYDAKKPVDIDLNIESSNAALPSLKELFSDEKVDLIYTEIALEGDMTLLKDMHAKRIEVKRFSYDGRPYKHHEIRKLFEKLKAEMASLTKAINENDAAIFQYFHSIEQSLGKGGELRRLYQNWIAFNQLFTEIEDFYNSIRKEIEFINEALPYAEVF
ncbi:MAG: hypothetical protein EP346_00265, partial [Bacteroidetes bacterium]